jgi:ribosomal protein S15P/S13E
MEENNPKEKKITQKEFEKKVIELAKKGITAEKIGEQLKKQGIHSKEFEKKISKILKEENIYQSPDLKNIESKLGRIKNHYEKNKQDKRAMREKDRVFAQMRKTKKYLKIPIK